MGTFDPAATLGALGMALIGIVIGAFMFGGREKVIEHRHYLAAAFGLGVFLAAAEGAFRVWLGG